MKIGSLFIMKTRRYMKRKSYILLNKKNNISNYLIQMKFFCPLITIDLNVFYILVAFIFLSIVF